MPTKKKNKEQTHLLTKNGVTEFSFSAPYAQNVSIAGSFNAWNGSSSRLTKDPEGNWRISLRLTPGRYQYRFVVDGKWTDDPCARETVQNGYGTRNAVLEVK